MRALPAMLDNPYGDLTPAERATQRDAFEARRRELYDSGLLLPIYSAARARAFAEIEQIERQLQLLDTAEERR